MSKTTWQETFRHSPRYAAIESVFAFIEKPSVTVNEIWAKAGEVMKDLNARDRLPGYVKAALVNREPIKVGPPPYR